MKVIIAGSRDITDLDEVIKAVKSSGFEITEVVSGTARGVDKLGEEYAKLNNIPVKAFPADWYNLGKKAGFRRNQEMLEYADALIAVWDGFSRGTQHMIDITHRKGKPYFVRNLYNND